MPGFTYLYLAYGADPSVHKQTLASICSLLSFDDGRGGRVVRVFTDAPAHYAWLGPAVQPRPIDAATLRRWEGPARFSFRTKPCLLLEAARDCAGHLLFLDGDTLVHDDPGSLENRLRDGQVLMHRREYQVSDRKSKERREYMKRLAGVELGGVALTEGSWMWNSGLIGLPNSELELPAAVLGTIDRMIELGLSARTRLKEQLAFSLHMDRTGRLAGADHAVIHYWGNKPEWNLWLDRWLLEVLAGQLDPPAAGRRARQLLPFPAEVAPKRSQRERQKAKLRKLLHLD